MTSAGHVYMWARGQVEQSLEIVIDNSTIQDNRGSSAISVFEYLQSNNSTATSTFAEEFKIFSQQRSSASLEV